MITKKVFESKLYEYGLVPERSTVLIGLSGGVDSVVLLNLFIESGIKVAIAHANFNLRGHESDHDEDFCRSLATKYQLAFYSKRFDTVLHAVSNKISIQMSARELRYEWFTELCNQHDFDRIAIAHHADDNLETILLHLSRGTGIAGLSGMPIKRDKIIRPLLQFSKDDILAYAKQQKLKWKEDSSNLKEIYKRNLIRHKIVPVLKEINPSILDAMNSNIKILKASENAYRLYITQLQNLYVVRKEDQILVDLGFFRNENFGHEYLSEILREFGFNQTQSDNIISAETGSEVKSGLYRCMIERDQLRLVKLALPRILPVEYLIDLNTTCLVAGKFVFTIEVKNVTDPLAFVANNLNIGTNYAFFDMDKLRYPLVVRNWKKGDLFFPLGMKGSKKLSDFFIDAKVSVDSKKQALIFCSGKAVVWVAGYRTDRRFMIDQATTRVMIIAKNEVH